MASLTQIANEALQLISEEPIISFDSKTPSAQNCRLAWPSVRDSVLRSFPWNCSKRRATLARLLDKPAFGYSYQFQLPTDCLRVLKTKPEIKYEIEDGRLLTDSESVSLIYIARVKDTSRYDSLLTEVMVYSLAMRLAHRVTGSKALSERLGSHVKGLERTARSLNSQENNPLKNTKSNWLAARRS